jgi:3-deoxy-D-manno-octulosonic-acid transferase
MHKIYSLYIFIRYYFLVLVPVYNKKASGWIKGRKRLLEKIALEIDHDADYVWFHCASAGEFEQGRPVIEKITEDNPGLKIILTFDSTEGYEMHKNYPLVSHVFYIPVDLPGDAKRFVEYVNPRLVVFINGGLHYNFLKALFLKKIPVVLISTIFTKEQIFFKKWGTWYRNQLQKITYFFVQDKNSQDLLYSIGIRNVVVSGDTRFDRVHEISRNPISYGRVETFIQGSVIFMAGSTWPADDELMIKIINQDTSELKYIIVPHEINQSQIENLKWKIKKPVAVLSEFHEREFKKARVLIIDKVGILANLYQYASVAYIGGGFGKGVHNILEAATFGMPVIFGPNYKKIAEARDLIKYGSAFSIKNEKELWSLCLKLLGNFALLKSTSEISREYVSLKRGGSGAILIFINAIINPMNFKPAVIEMPNMN